MRNNLLSLNNFQGIYDNNLVVNVKSGNIRNVGIYGGSSADHHIRPSVVLNAGTTISGGVGTKTSPYVIN